MSRYKWCAGLTLGLMVSFLLFPEFPARAQAAWQVLFNGTVSKTQIVNTESGDLVPVYFEVPREGETESYGVLLETDSANKQVKVTRVKKKGPLTERGDCPKCGGSKDCQSCYPAGTGKNTAGYECYSCNASGDCPYCRGSGLCYQCGGKGYPNGCGTCGDVSS